MSLNKGQQILAWAILFACLAAVPAAMLGKASSSTATNTNKNEPGGKRLSSFLNKDRILVLRLNGVISDDESSSFFPDRSSSMYVRKALRKAASNDHVKAVLLRINSPGGTVATSQEIYDAVKALKEKGKPVLVSMGDVAASGGYYIASAADRIVADPGTLTGSIGVIMHLMNFQEIEKKIGIQPVVIKSGAFKDIGSADRPMRKEEKELLQAIIMDSYDQFVTAVSQGRNMDKEQVKKLADGRIYSGRQAYKVKLVDELGGYEEALVSLQNLTKAKYHLSKDLDVDEGKSSMGFFASLLESSFKGGQNISLSKGLLPESMDPRFCNQPLWLMQ